MAFQQVLEHKGADRFEVWQLLPVRIGDHILELENERRERVAEFAERWVLVAVFSNRDEAIRFWNASFLASKEQAPRTAGVGDGRSLREPWISALKARSVERAWEGEDMKGVYQNA